MKPEEHNRTVGLLHIVYAGIQSLVMLGMILLFLVIGPITANPPRGGVMPVAFFAMIMALIVFFQALFTIPSFVAGYGLLKQKKWAKTAGIIAGVLAAISFPQGQLCVSIRCGFCSARMAKRCMTGLLIGHRPCLMLYTQRRRNPSGVLAPLQGNANGDTFRQSNRPIGVNRD